MLLLSQAALTRGDFATALSRAEDARVTYALETVGRFNLAAYVLNNWQKLGIATIGAALLSWQGFKNSK